VFSSSGDSIPFEVTANQNLFEYFLANLNSSNENQFLNNHLLANVVEQHVTTLHTNISRVNELLPLLNVAPVEINLSPTAYLNQDYLNRVHANWVISQNIELDIEKLRFSTNAETATIGNQLHHMYPDEIRIVKIADVLTKLDFIDAYEAINIAVHNLECVFINDYLIFDSPGKWNVFDNPFKDSILTNNGVTNFNFGYTYLGRKYYNKFINFDNDLTYDDHYNFEQLEFSFNINLSKPQTIPFSNQFLEWCATHNIPPIGNEIPIGNILDLHKNLALYREILYRNSKENNKASIVIQ
jgi:hypothetical protein